MKNIMILGNGAIVSRLVDELMGKKDGYKISIFSTDQHYPYDSGLFPKLLSKEITPQKVYAKPNSFYVEQGIEVITGKKITRINPNRRRIFTEEKETYDFDCLIMSSAQDYRFPDIKGTNKTGVFGIGRLGDIDGIVNMLPLGDTITIEARSFSGLQIAAALARRKKEVIVFIPENNPFISGISPEVESWFCEYATARGIRCEVRNNISEILGDSHVKAVRLKSGKVLASQLVIFDDLGFDLRFLGDDIVHENGRVGVDENFRTNQDTIYAVGTLAGGSVFRGNILPSEIFDFQAKTVVGKLLGNSSGITSPIVNQRFSVDDLSVTFLSDVSVTSGSTSLEAFDKDRGAYLKVNLDGNIARSAILINRDVDVPAMEALLKGEKKLDELNVFDAVALGISEPGTGCDKSTTGS